MPRREYVCPHARVGTCDICTAAEVTAREKEEEEHDALTHTGNSMLNIVFVCAWSFVFVVRVFVSVLFVVVCFLVLSSVLARSIRGQFAAIPLRRSDFGPCYGHANTHHLTQSMVNHQLYNALHVCTLIVSGKVLTCARYFIAMSRLRKYLHMDTNYRIAVLLSYSYTRFLVTSNHCDAHHWHRRDSEFCTQIYRLHMPFKEPGRVSIPIKHWTMEAN